MSLPPNSHLGPYQILAPLGAGGMGEVYRARDMRLDRDVAIKVLPEVLARDKERILRFELEAKVLASLNHPNIAAIYGFEEFEGKRFLVMELAEGETLAERLDRGPILIRDAMEFANGIAIANSPTITLEHTRPGMVLGTAACMSPEQARERALDKRTDVWSFGALLYECLAGRRPFEGETTSDLVAKILEREPDWSALPAASHSVN